MDTKIHQPDMTDPDSRSGLDEMIAVIAATDDTKLLHDFFACLFTPAELKDINNRWLLVKEIKKGTTQRDIAHMFRMSLCKITRGSKELKKEGSAFKTMIEKSELLQRQ